jgi:hypothetical protein
MEQSRDEHEQSCDDPGSPVSVQSDQTVPEVQIILQRRKNEEKQARCQRGGREEASEHQGTSEVARDRAQEIHGLTDSGRSPMAASPSRPADSRDR